MSLDGDQNRLSGRRLAFARAVVLAAVGLVVAVVVLSAAGEAYAASPPTLARSNPDVDPGSAAGGGPAPAFRLRDQRGRPTSLAQFRGKVVALAFVDSECTTICPLTTQSMVEAKRLLGAAAARVQLLGIDANPDAHRVADVAAYTHAHGMQGRWRFLTGSRAQLVRVWRAYHVYVAAVHNNIDHEPIVFLIDGQGRERTIYLTQMRYEGVTQQAQLIADGIARLLPGHPPVHQIVSLRYVPPSKPAAAARLNALGSSSQAVSLGRGHPHLLVFFATWLSETSNLPAELATLDRYATVARADAWPLPVAVDELPTETSSTDVHAQLTRLAASLSVPIVEDRDGRFADGYGVHDQPWYVLTSRTGHILWHHDGWLTSAALSQQVRASLSRGS